MSVTQHQRSGQAAGAVQAELSPRGSAKPVRCDTEE